MSRYVPSCHPLGEQISELAAQLNAATCAVIELIGRFDVEKGWARGGKTALTNLVLLCVITTVPCTKAASPCSRTALAPFTSTARTGSACCTHPRATPSTVTPRRFCGIVTTSAASTSTPAPPFPAGTGCPWTTAWPWRDCCRPTESWMTGRERLSCPLQPLSVFCTGFDALAPVLHCISPRIASTSNRT